MKIVKWIFIFSLLLLPLKSAHAAPEWTWVCSNNYHTHFYTTDGMEIKKGETGEIIRLDLWRKTTYNYAGAQGELEDYKELSKLTTPSQLSYSIQRVELYLQSREIRFVRTSFYDAENRLIYSVNNDSREMEIEPLYFEEDFFCKMRDIYYGTHDDDYRKSEERWLRIGGVKYSDNSYAIADIDTMSIRKWGNEYRAWKVICEYDANKKLKSTMKIKTVYDFRDGTMADIKMSVWTPNDGVIQTQKHIKPDYAKPIPGTIGANEFKLLKEYIETHKDFINRCLTSKSS